MNNTELAQSASDFLAQLKIEVRKQVSHLNAIADGELQDGINCNTLEDGWVTLKGYSWGFAMNYDDPVRLDMVFGPDQPFVGYRITFTARIDSRGLTWSTSLFGARTLQGPEAVAAWGLRQMLDRVGDAWLLDSLQGSGQSAEK